MLRYETAAGVKIVLDDYLGSRTIWELFGRTGFAAPPIEYIDETYAAGYSETIAARLLPRDVAIPLVIHGQTQMERDSILQGIADRLLQHGVQPDWGRLVFTRSDGKDAYLNCLYTSGLETIAEEDPFIYKAVLNFHASDPYIYAMEDTIVPLSDGNTGLLFGTFTFGAGVYFRGRLDSVVSEIFNAGHRVYPEIFISGPAEAIRIKGLDNGAVIAFQPYFKVLAGETVRIDCRDRRRGVWLTGVDGVVSDITSKLALESSLLFSVLPGVNRFQFDYTNATPATRLFARYRERRFSA